MVQSLAAARRLAIVLSWPGYTSVYPHMHSVIKSIHILLWVKHLWIGRLHWKYSIFICLYDYQKHSWNILPFAFPIHIFVITPKWKENTFVRYRTNYMIWLLTPPMTLIFYTRSNMETFASQESLVWLIWSKKEVNQLDTGLTIWPCHLTTLMTLTLKFQGLSLK